MDEEMENFMRQSMRSEHDLITNELQNSLWKALYETWTEENADITQYEANREIDKFCTKNGLERCKGQLKVKMPDGRYFVRGGDNNYKEFLFDLLHYKLLYP